ncbi:hypothetical protein LIER_36056 [Lithospermum erythrorhizon]|uniref:Uncharacterized protein n=1 Tax=Lithospermum erythrorhizon TaxID=34254 RepID=A0AAV3P4W1_LITER
MVTVRACVTVVDIADLSYNGLIGRPLLTALRAIVSPLHLKMKFPTSGEMTGDQTRGRECYQLSIPMGLSMRDPPKRKLYQEKHPGARAHSDDPRASPGMIYPRRRCGMRTRRGPCSDGPSQKSAASIGAICGDL